MSEKKKLIILTGPTAVGKTELSIGLAKAIGGEIISADSMQVYKKMDIGSAKIKKEEMDGVKHHLVDLLEPTEPFDVTVFQKAAFSAMEEIYKRGNIPIIVGGTGFYIQSVLYAIDFEREDETNGEIRERLSQYAKQFGAEKLHERLKEIDPVSASMIHANNVKRVIRAIEFYELTGQKISEHNERQRSKESPFAFCYFVLNDTRSSLYERIDRRVDLMIEAGLVAEVEKLLSLGCQKGMTSMQGLGYKEIIAYLQGEYSLEHAIYLIKRDTRHFAKRQLTWFRREPDVVWVNKDELKQDNSFILHYMLSVLQEKNLLDPWMETAFAYKY